MKKLNSHYSRGVYEKTAELFKIMANAKRLEILNLLKNQDLSVTEIAKACATQLHIVAVGRIPEYAETVSEVEEA